MTASNARREDRAQLVETRSRELDEDDRIAELVLAHEMGEGLDMMNAAKRRFEERQARNAEERKALRRLRDEPSVLVPKTRTAASRFHDAVEPCRRPQYLSRYEEMFESEAIELGVLPCGDCGRLLRTKARARRLRVVPRTSP